MTPVPNRKIKIIDCEWNAPTISFYVKNLKAMEIAAPVNGLSFILQGKGRSVNGKWFVPSSYNPMGTIPWKYEDFTSEIARYKKVESKKFTDNFIMMTVSPGTADWFSDDDWETVVQNYAIGARVAKETGMKGIILDTEEYGPGYFWHYQPANFDNRSFDDAQIVAQQRGREWGNAVFKAYPDMTLFCFWTFSGHQEYFCLISSFWNGVLDVMPSTVQLIEGHERLGYHAKNREDLSEMIAQIFTHLSCRIAPHNRAKFRSQVNVAPALYLDPILNHAYKKHWREDLGLDSQSNDLLFFQRKLYHSIQASDGYVWFWGERGRWWDLVANDTRIKPWEDYNPGITQVINDLMSPEKIDVSKRKNDASDLATWNYYNNKDLINKTMKPTGKGSFVHGIFRIEGALLSCFASPSLPVKPGRIYLLRVDVRHEKNSSGNISLFTCFRDSMGKNLPWQTRRYHEVTRSTNGSWVTLNMLVPIPNNAHSSKIELQAGSMRTNDAVNFRNVFWGELTADSRIPSKNNE